MWPTQGCERGLAHAIEEWASESLYFYELTLAHNRKTALFVRSDEGGDNCTVIATLIENCKISGMSPRAWLTGRSPN